VTAATTRIFGSMSKSARRSQSSYFTFLIAAVGFNNRRNQTACVGETVPMGAVR
jgi:hypothetical protein